MSIGKKILQARQQAHLTQRDIAQRTGMAESYLSRIENNHIEPSIHTLNRIAHAIGVPLTTFVDIDIEDNYLIKHCPVSLSGSCIVESGTTGHGRKNEQDEVYTQEQIEILCKLNAILHSNRKDFIQSLKTIIESMMISADITIEDGE